MGGVMKIVFQAKVSATETFAFQAKVFRRKTFA